jgi:hypothetical protein
VSHPPAPFVVDSVHPRRLGAIAGVRRRTEPRRRVERRRRCDLAFRAALVGFPVARASCWCRLRTKPSPPAQFHVQRRRPPPRAVAGRRRPLATRRQRPRAIRAVGLRSDAPVQSRRPQATTTVRSRSNGSRSGQPGQLGQTRRQPWRFCRKAPGFSLFTKIPFHRISFLTV